MASRLEQAFLNNGVDALDRTLFRDGIVFTPVGGTSRTIRAQITPVRDEFDPQFDRGYMQTRRVRCVARNDATLGIDRVFQGDTVTVDGITYGVDSGAVGNDGLTRLQLVRSVDKERTSQNWRRS